jgi:arylsulfatase A-like enzyme
VGAGELMRWSAAEGRRGTPPLLLTLLAAAFCFCGCSTDPPRPNVVLISIDCLNERQLAAAMENGAAPSLQALAAESLVFTRAYAHAPWTTPSHMSMLSGLYPSEHGRDVSVMLADQFGQLGERVSAYETLGDRLGAAGYETVGFVGKGSISAKYGLGQGFERYSEADRHGPAQSDLVHSMAAVEDWLERRAPRPFFLFFHTYDLHYPLPKARATDAESIRHVDGHLGRLLSRLEEKGLYESTLVVLTGDHGSNMIHTDGKCCVHGAGHYEENLRVPLWLKLPAAGRTGRTDALVRHIDILPTVLEVVGLERGGYAGAGISLLAGRGDDALSYSEADARCVQRRAVVGRRYKYIYTVQDPVAQALRSTKGFSDPLCDLRPACSAVPREELYDIDTDPFEERDLLAGDLTPAAAAALERLRAELERHLNLPRQYRLATLTGGGKAAPGAEIDDGVRDALRALGYAE